MNADANRRLARRLALVAVTMIGFGFLLVPLYRVYCSKTGADDLGAHRIGYADAVRQKVDTRRWVTVEFVATTNGSLPWQFGPDRPRVRVHPGDLTLVRFHARNLSRRAIVGQAVHNVLPDEAAQYFHKLECFCFTRQPLAPGEAKEMPVEFQIDPRLPADITTLTLGYTFFEVPGAGARKPPA